MTVRQILVGKVEARQSGVTSPRERCQFAIIFLIIRAPFPNLPKNVDYSLDCTLFVNGRVTSCLESLAKAINTIYQLIQTNAKDFCYTILYFLLQLFYVCIAIFQRLFVTRNLMYKSPAFYMYYLIRDKLAKRDRILYRSFSLARIVKHMICIIFFLCVNVLMLFQNIIIFIFICLVGQCLSKRLIIGWTFTIRFDDKRVSICLCFHVHLIYDACFYITFTFYRRLNISKSITCSVLLPYSFIVYCLCPF